MLLARIDETDIDSFAQVCTLLREHRQGDELRLELRQPDDTEIRILQTRLRIGEPAPSTPTEIGRQPNPRPARPALVTSWTFDRPEEAADWPTGSSQVGSGTVSGGRYAITLAQPNAFGLFQPLTVPPGTDQRITAVVSLPDEAGAGLVVRSSQDADGTRNLYLCAVVRTGGQLVATCSLAIVGQSAVLLPVTPLASLDPTTDPLTLEFEARSTHLVFRVAGQTVADLTDPLLGHGQAGLWVESFATAPVTVAFDEVTLEIVPR
jgi:hypothetical protein